MKKNANDPKGGRSGRPVPWKSMLLAFVLAVGLIAMGLLLPPREDGLYGSLWYGSTAAVLLFYLANIICLLLMARRSRQLNRDLHKSKEMFDARKDLLESDRERAEKRMDRRILLAWVYYALLFLTVSVNLLLIRQGPDTLVYWMIVIDYLILWSLVEVWFRNASPEIPELELSREEYPVFYGMAEHAEKAAGSSLPLRLFAGGTSLSVARGKGELWLFLDAVTCSLLTKRECYQALLHEFAHEINGDTRRSERINREVSRWGAEEGSLTRFGDFLLTFPSWIVTMEYLFYSIFSRKYKETLADREAVRLGSAEDMVNGLAKLSVWDFFESEPNPAISQYGEYAGEAPLENYPARALEAYKAVFPAKAEEWRHRLDVELPPRVSTHPIFRERREAFGVEEYRFDTVETDEAYLRECGALLGVTGKAIARQMSETYEEDRRRIYLERRELIDRAKEVEDWSALSMDERIEMARALAVEEPELQETAIRSILREDPESNYGTMLLAAKRFRENDPSCVELLKLAAERNHNFADDAYSMLGSYASRNGLADLLEEYRSDVVDVAQDALDTSQSLSLKWDGREPLAPNQLDPATAEEVRLAILERTEGKLERLYTVQKPAFGDRTGYFYVLQFPEDMPSEEQRRLYEKVFLYLDYREELFSLDNVTGNRKHQEYLLKRVPDCSLPLQGP